MYKQSEGTEGQGFAVAHLGCFLWFSCLIIGNLRVPTPKKITRASSLFGDFGCVHDSRLG